MPATRLIAISLWAAFALFTGPAQAAPSQQPDLIWGINGHPLISYPGVSIETQLDAVRDLGMTSYRVDVGGMEHIPDMRSLVREAGNRGITVSPVITPQFDLAKESAEALEQKAYGLAFALVSSFKGQIPVWELGNEMENYAIIQPCEMQDDGKQYSCSFGPAGGVTSLEYFGPRWAKVSAVLKGLSRGAHNADPSVRRALGTAGWGHLGAFERMQADGIEWDISVWHMYGEDPEWAFKELVKYGKPIWVTEFNHPEGSTKSAEAQAQGLTRAIAMLSDLQGSYNIEAAHVYELLDEPYWKDYEAHMGLIEVKPAGQRKWALGEPKPAYAAVKAQLAPATTATESTTVAAQQRALDIRRQCEPKSSPDTAVVATPDVIAYAYCLVLGRDPDGAGLDSWQKLMAGGMPVQRLLVDLMQSQEFAELYDLPELATTERVRLIHLLLLGAEPDQSTLKKAIVEFDAQKSPTSLQEGLIASKEFRALHQTLFAKRVAKVETVVASDGPRAKPEVRRNCDVSIMRRPLEFERGKVIYGFCLVLGRWPDAIGMQSWRDTMRRGMTLERFLIGLLQSDEFVQKYQVQSLDDAAFVTLAYRLLLDRDPDAKGLDSYVSGLASGAFQRTEIYEGIINSQEFRKKQEALYTALTPERARAELQRARH